MQETHKKSLVLIQVQNKFTHYNKDKFEVYIATLAKYINGHVFHEISILMDEPTTIHGDLDEAIPNVLYDAIMSQDFKHGAHITLQNDSIVKKSNHLAISDSESHVYVGGFFGEHHNDSELLGIVLNALIVKHSRSTIHMIQPITKVNIRCLPKHVKLMLVKIGNKIPSGKKWPATLETIQKSTEMDNDTNTKTPQVAAKGGDPRFLTEEYWGVWI